MQTIRVLIVDDAVMVRSRLKKILSSDAQIEVVGVAATGQIALAKLQYSNTHVVILDVEMPEMDGLETLRQIRQINSRLPVIMFSSLTTSGASATIDALTLGASDYVAKPNHLGDVDAIAQYIQENLTPKIKALGENFLQQSQLKPSSIPAVPSSTAQLTRAKPQIEIVAIGVSTGGPNALTTLLTQLPSNFPVPIAIVQHMPPMFTKLLAERLSTKCALPVQEAEDGTELRAGTIWIAPGDYHLRVKKVNSTVQLAIDRSLPQNSCRPSVDVLFESVAQVYGERTLSVILTGMGQDGLRGCQKIRDCNGQILAQDEASSVVWGMPRFVVDAGLADAVLPLDQIASEILLRVRRNSRLRSID